MQGVIRHHNSGRSAQHGQQQALGKQLPDYAASACSDGRPDRHFVLAAGGPGQEQIRDVRASNQQHKAYRAQQDQQGRARFAYERFQRRPHGGPAGVGVRVRILLCQGLSDHIEVGARLLDADAGFEAAERPQEVSATLLGDGLIP